MDDDYKKFCLRCNWNDEDYGCTVRHDEIIYQCEMYIHYHPEEVKKFNEEMSKL